MDLLSMRVPVSAECGDSEGFVCRARAPNPGSVSREGRQHGGETQSRRSPLKITHTHTHTQTHTHTHTHRHTHAHARAHTFRLSNVLWLSFCPFVQLVI